MKILVIGGTSFVGRYLVEAAIEKGHEVVLFNRGKTNVEVFKDLRHIQGDRRIDAKLVGQEQWDVVFDTCAYSPQDLQPMIDSLKNKTKTYMFISTISVYDDYQNGRPNELSSTFTKKIETDEVTGETYGPLKVMCEQLVNDIFKECALIIRPCIVVGPHDPTDRFTYYAKRLTKEGKVAIPGGDELNRLVQWIDVRDIAKWIVQMVEEGKSGTFNAASDPLSLNNFIDEITTEVIEKKWISDEVLEKENLGARRYPFWMPISSDYPEGFFIVKNQKAVENGLTFRSLAKTAQDTRDWAENRELKAGPTIQQEQLLIKNN
ncbi:NAD-dependent epimerase/dehydratase family protein [Paenisporosarcina sp. TG-14]|uniref:NAD-dependent epimerase/dehydratase family protein n=1 Tax=Paenisporosarcina sp. TG-14 TaxID=1231057 RepID=UPI0003193F17|nr:NAD-dependent epimerase/dehydratase family protein [Paenisporosarcina sp. TG-14]